MPDLRTKTSVSQCRRTFNASTLAGLKPKVLVRFWKCEKRVVLIGLFLSLKSLGKVPTNWKHRGAVVCGLLAFYDGPSLNRWI